MRWLAATAVMLVAGCSQRPAPLPPAASALSVERHCVSAVVRMGTDEVSWHACASVDWACEYLEALLAAHGGRAGVLALGECVVRDGE